MSSVIVEVASPSCESPEGAESGAARARPRDRIVAAARELFHKNGIRGVGVDAIAEAAGTNKMTLYRHFGSKDDLVVACLGEVAREVEAAWSSAEDAFPDDPRRQLANWVMRAARWIADDGRGCHFSNAAVELADCLHPAKRVVEEFKTAQRERLARLCDAAGASQPSLLADALSLLLEGARVSRQSVGAEGPSARFVRLAEAVIESFGVDLASTRPSTVEAERGARDGGGRGGDGSTA